MLDDRVCPACRVLLRDGADRCVKCGRFVEQPKTDFAFLDWPAAVHPWLAKHLGPFWGGVATFVLFLSLFVLVVGVALLTTLLRAR